jgi:ABC-type branched-subunit amino acid transport system ATPase component/ABC-type branched-subunit amino acid transport system permease subunit
MPKIRSFALPGRAQQPNGNGSVPDGSGPNGSGPNGALDDGSSGDGWPPEGLLPTGVTPAVPGSTAGHDASRRPRVPAWASARNASIAVTAVVVLAVVSAALPHVSPAGVVLQGAELGAVNGLLALGLVLTYRSNRIINFSYGAMGGLAGTFGVMLDLGKHVNWFVALGAGLLAGALIGGLVEALVIRKFFNAPRLVLTVATIGLAQVLGGVQLMVPRWLGGPPLVGGLRTPLTAAHVRIHPVLFTGDDALIVIVVPLVLAAMGWFLLRTDAGVAVRAVADNSDRALLLGIPLRRLSTLVWVIAGVLAALTVMLNAPSQGLTLSAAAGPQLLLPALAAAVVARMESLPIAFGAGVGLGIVDSLVRFNVSKEALSDVAFLAVILIALLVQRKKLSRGQESEGSWLSAGVTRPIPSVLRRLPEVTAARVFLGLAGLAAVLLIPVLFGPGTVNEATITVTYAMVVVSLVVLSGWAGSISLGQFAFAGVGGVIAGDLMSKWNVDFFLSLAAAGAAGALLALIVGVPALRIRGLFLAVTTLALAVAVDSFFLNPTNFEKLIPASITRPLLWQRFDLQNVNDFYYFSLGILLVTILFVRGLRGARAGRVLIATRDNPRAAGAMAVPTVRVKLVGFVLAGTIAGVAGAIHAATLGSVGFHTYDPSTSLLLFSMAVIGGLGSISGALSGVIAIQVAVHAFPQYQLLITGSGLLTLLTVLPGGIAEAINKVRDMLLRLVANRRGLLVPSLVADRAETKHAAHAPHEEQALSAALSDTKPTDSTSQIPVIDLDNPPEADRVAVGDKTKGKHQDLAEPVPVLDPAGPAPLLSCRGVEVSYGPVQILFGVDLEVHEGEIVALLGTNGAGKSTLLRAITGLNKVGGGRVELSGRKISNLSADATARQGVALMPGGRGVFPTLTVEDNLRLASWLIRKDRKAAVSARSAATAVFPVLGQRMSQLAGDLSGGEQQMLSLAMAMVVKPRLLAIDELSLGLAPTVVAQLLEVVRNLHRDGVTIVIVEQSVNVALQLAQRAVFLEKGEVRFSGPTADLLERPDVLRAVFIAGAAPEAAAGSANGAATDEGAAGADGRPAAKPARKRRKADPNARKAPAADAPIVLETRGLTKRFGGIRAVGGVDLALREGEILGLIGHNGAGKTTMFDCISGFLAIDGGRILMGGMDIASWPAHMRAVAGLGRSFQEAKLFPSLTVTDTIAVALERHLASRDLVAAGLRLPASTDSEATVSRRVAGLVELMNLEAYSEKLTGELSTGTRRIVELACVLAQDPAVLLLDEPSGGVAQRETEALAPLLLRVQQQTGCSIVVIEHDMPLLTSICDRMIALELGEVIASGPPARVLEDARVVESYLGTDESTIHRSGTGAQASSKQDVPVPV